MRQDKLIMYEVDLQNDFMNADGNLYVPGAEIIKPTVENLVGLANKKNIRRVQSIDRHFFNDPELTRNDGPFPDHCMNGTYGAELIKELGMEYRINVQNKFARGEDNIDYDTEDIEEIINDGRTIVFEKQHYDVFTNANAKPILQKMGVEEAVVYGVATDYCVKAAVLGMQDMGIQTYVVTDAIKGIATNNDALYEMQDAGAKLMTYNDIDQRLRN